jgi:hypothetical protein
VTQPAVESPGRSMTSSTTAGALPRAVFALAGFVILVVVGLTLFAASGGVRGTDQFWYLADVDTLVHSHVIATNTVLPVGLLGTDPTLPPPFIHNILSVYLAAVPAFVVGAFGGWLTLNILATLGTSILVFAAARTVAGFWAALIAAVLYPVLPLTVWQTAQPLAEASTAFFAALTVWCVAVAGSSWRGWAAVAGAAGLLTLSRESYLPILILVPFGYAVARIRSATAPHARADNLPTERSADGVPTPARARWPASACDVVRSLPSIVAVAVVAGGFWVASATLLGQENVHPSYTRLLHTAVPGQTDNMWFNFDLSPASLADRLSFDPGLLVTKLAGHIRDQLVAFDSVPAALFYWTFNILAGLAIVALWRGKRSAGLRLIVLALAFVGVHILTIALFQNQFRYTLPAIPSLLVVLAMLVSDIAWLDRRVAKRAVAAAAVLVVLAAVPDGILARQARADGLTSTATASAADALFARVVPTSDRMVIVYTASPHVLAYAARPRLVVYVPTTYGRGEFDRVRQAFAPRWLLAPPDPVLLATFGVDSSSGVGAITASDTEWELYRLSG